MKLKVTVNWETEDTENRATALNAGNAKKMLDYTGIKQLHSSCKDWHTDSTTSRDEVNFSYHGDDYEVVSQELVEILVELVEGE